jgi:hypothetical protein
MRRTRKNRMLTADDRQGPLAVWHRPGVHNLVSAAKAQEGET